MWRKLQTRREGTQPLFSCENGESADLSGDLAPLAPPRAMFQIAITD